MSKKNSKRRVWRGVTTATASLLALSVCASTVVDGFRTDIDKFLGTKSTKLVTEDTDGVDLYTFKSDYTSTTDLLHGIQDVGERMSEEGSVLLKNNGALPLTKDETQKITLLGFSSYYPVQGGDMGSSLSENTGTDADTVDMVGAFKAKGLWSEPDCGRYVRGPAAHLTSLRSRAGAASRSTTTSLRPPRPAFSPARSRARLRWTARMLPGRTA